MSRQYKGFNAEPSFLYKSFFISMNEEPTGFQKNQTINQRLKKELKMQRHGLVCTVLRIAECGDQSG